MFNKDTSRRSKAERIAGQAWDHLTSAVDNAEATTKDTARRAVSYYDHAADRFDSGRTEAARRANAAYAALSGRRQRTNWGPLAAAILVGAAVGWVATRASRASRASRQAVDRSDPIVLPESLADEFARTRP